jgi:hypothetical protein
MNRPANDALGPDPLAEVADRRERLRMRREARHAATRQMIRAPESLGELRPGVTPAMVRDAALAGLRRQRAVDQIHEAQLERTVPPTAP